MRTFIMMRGAILLLVAIGLTACSKENASASSPSVSADLTQKKVDAVEIKETLLGTWAVLGWQLNRGDSKYYRSLYVFQENKVLYVTLVSLNGEDVWGTLGVSGKYQITPDPETRSVFLLSVTPDSDTLWVRGTDGLEAVAPEKGSDNWRNMINYQEHLKREHRISIIGDRLYVDDDGRTYAYWYTKVGHSTDKSAHR